MKNENKLMECILMISNLRKCLKEADISAMATAADPEQFKEVDFTHPSVLNPLKMIVPVGVEESLLFDFVRPFQPLVRAN